MFFHYRKYVLIFLSMIIIGIASGFIQVILYNLLSSNNYSPFFFTLAFLAGLIPGILSSHLGTNLVLHAYQHIYLTFVNIFFALAVGLILLFHLSDNVFLLLVLECITSAVLGIFFPILQTVIKNTFKDERLALAAKIDVYAFSFQIIFGIGAGAVLINKVSAEEMLVIDLFLFLISGLVVFFAQDDKPLNGEHTKAISKEASLFRDYTSKQKRAFLMMPLLMLVGSPLSALLPSLNDKFGPIMILNFELKPVHYLLISRSLGQLIGPLLVPKGLFSRIAKSNGVMLSFLVLFTLFYALLDFAGNPLVLLVVVIVAHAFSNMFYSLSFYLLQVEFAADQIPSVSGKQYRFNLTASLISTLFFGMVSNYSGAQVVLWQIFGLTAVLYAIFLIREKLGNDS